MAAEPICVRSLVIHFSMGAPVVLEPQFPSDYASRVLPNSIVHPCVGSANSTHFDWHWAAFLLRPCSQVILDYHRANFQKDVLLWLAFTHFSNTSSLSPLVMAREVDQTEGQGAAIVSCDNCGFFIA